MLTMKGRVLRSLALLVVLAVACTAEDEEEVKQEVIPGETGKIYFSGTGYTINLIPHVIILGLGLLAFLFLYGGDLSGASSDTSASYGAPDTGYGAPATGYGAPSTGYGAPSPSYDAPAPSYAAPSPGYAAPATVYAALSRYYDPYDSSSGLATWDPVNGQESVQVPTKFNPELNPYNIPQTTVEGRRKKRWARY